MFIETSSPRRNRDKARFESEEFQPTGSSGRCLKFWYHMYGSSIGGLNVWMSSNGSTGQIWTLSGNQRQDKWFYAQAPVRSANVYQVCRRLKLNQPFDVNPNKPPRKYAWPVTFWRRELKRTFLFCPSNKRLVHRAKLVCTLECLLWSLVQTSGFSQINFPSEKVKENWFEYCPCAW